MNFHGGYFGKDKKKILDFSVNLNPLGVPNSVKEYIINHVNDLDTYPEIDARTAKECIAKKNNLSTKNIIMGNGAVEVIYLLARTVKPKTVLILQPTFNEYERAFTQSGAKCIGYCLEAKNGFALDLEDVLDKIEKIRPEIMVICNPNNPTGGYIKKTFIERILLILQTVGGILMVDESFSSFEGLDTGISLLNYENLLLLRSMTKIYAIAGIRLGFGIGHEKIIERMNHYKEPWTLNTIACSIVSVLLSDYQYERKTRKWYEEEKKYFREKLLEVPFLHPFDSKTNFFLCRTDKKANLLKEKLLQRGIFIRTCDDFENLKEDYIRIAIRNRWENEELFKVLKKINFN